MVSINTNLISKNLLSQDNSFSLLKEIIHNKNEEITKKFNPQQAVDSLLLEKSVFIDEILINCWHHFLKEQAQHLCLIATGGYGRNELFPNSDMDILILLKDSDIQDFQNDLSDFSNYLWDIGLKPGQSVRTIAECLQQASEDQTIMTNLLEFRLITGSPVLFSDLNKQINRKELWSSKDFFSAKMQEQEARYAKYHDTAYNLEPNIKEGPGGLRDLQNIAWVFKHHYKTSSLNELIEYDLLSEAEFNELKAARNILWAIRFALHTLTHRCEDRLLFNHQRDMAQQFGFTNENNEPDVEQFMQHYFKTVMELERMNEMLLQLFKENFFDTSLVKQLYPVSKYFVSVNKYIEVKELDTFEKYPLALLEIFLVLQLNPSLVGVRASTIRLIRKNLYLIDDSFRNDSKANKLFIAIFKSPRGLTHQLRQMNRYGVLAAYLPSFANIVARMQYDLFHIYTVDAHTLFVLRNLRRLSIEKHQDELPFCNSIFLRIRKPEILYFAALFHDIAKGLGGDHSILGEEIARNFCKQHGLPKSDSKLITWIVCNHLIMSTTAQKKDINNPDVVHKFALQVGNIEYLNHLYLFTVADIRGTNPSLWNSWKDSLLLELYRHTRSALHRGLKNPIARSKRLYENKQEAKDGLIGLGISEATINNTWKRISDDYFLCYSADEIAWHTIAIASTPKSELPLVLLRPQNQRGSVEVFVYANNENNIFSISVNTLDQLGLTVLDARIITIPLSETEQCVLNSFQVLEQTGESINNLDREIRICKTLQLNLLNLKVNEQPNIHRESRQAKHFPIASKVYFHKDPLSKYTMIELITTDHAGLLAIIGQVFNDLELVLHNAKIATIGSRAEDMFYVTDTQLRPISDENVLETIQTQLLLTLQNKENK
ncbi:MAG: [protein-PII] uridylyltransferase [Methylococcales symbiont of Iophon sp. n. MRB-2018]|nr:MAG: [protein-PII] uridylyltransferase [Methylococcales symbiont of Iophon sp. n. MRB-2018]KAF3980578.1 MAG: [protein-PII] uridylyltransferase [Methylococcales symbiont of Iophon sp. n. MRB-2018]